MRHKRKFDTPCLPHVCPISITSQRSISFADPSQALWRHNCNMQAAVCAPSSSFIHTYTYATGSFRASTRLFSHSLMHSLRSKCAASAVAVHSRKGFRSNATLPSAFLACFMIQAEDILRRASMKIGRLRTPPIPFQSFSA